MSLSCRLNTRSRGGFGSPPSSSVVAPDVSSGGALDDEARDAALNLPEFVLVNLDFDGFQLHSLFLARQLIRRTPFHFFRGKGRRHLLEPPDAFFGKLFEDRRIQSRRSVRTLRFSIGIVRIRRKAKPKARLITLAASRIELHQPRGAAQQQHQNSGRQRIERAQMSDLPEARQMPHGIDNVVGRLTFRLVYDKRSVDRRRLWLSWHKSVVSFQFLV